MSRLRTAARLSATLCLLVIAACGKKGNPLPPLRPVPARVADLSAVRTDARVTLRFTVPAANVDGTTPAAIDHVDIFRVSGPQIAAAPPAAAAAPTPAAPGALTTPAAPTAPAPAGAGTPPGSSGAPAAPGAPGASSAAANAPGPLGAAAPSAVPTASVVAGDVKNRVATITVQRPVPASTAGEPAPGSAPGRAGAPAAPPADAPPPQGSVATFVDPVTSTDSGVRYYVAVPVAGSGRGRPGAASAVVAVPLDPVPAPPNGIAITNDDKVVTITWEAAEAGQTFAVLRQVGSSFDVNTATTLTSEPLARPTFTIPVAFGQPLCVAVRATKATGPVRVEGPPSAPSCYTPVDRFPPPAPGELQAVQDGAVVTLIWNRSDAADLAGYIVLRGEGTTGALQPLMRAPIAETSYKDTTAQPGTTYTYAVYAVDNAPAPNISPLSDRQTVVMR